MIAKTNYEVREYQGATGVMDNFKYSYSSGLFIAIKNKTELFYATTCREGFAHYFNENTTHCCFYATKVDLIKVGEFFGLVEKRLKLKKKEDKIIIYPTKFDSILGKAFIVEIPKFWSCTSFRRGVFTLFLRCATIYYNGDKNLEGAFSRYNLASGILPMLQRFLSGHTATNLNISSEYNISYKFKNMSVDGLNQSLFIPGKPIKRLKTLADLKPVTLF